MNLNNVKLFISAGRVDQFPRDGLPQVVFSGKSNVGKSSLINRLLGRKALARVSSAPGKTVTVNFYEIDGTLYFVDLPGYGYAKRSYEKKEAFSGLTDGYLNSDCNIALFIQLFDLKVGLSENDAMMLDWLTQNRLHYILVGTKADKLNKTQLASAQTDIHRPFIPFSSLTGSGTEEIWERINATIGQQ